MKAIAPGDACRICSILLPYEKYYDIDITDTSDRFPWISHTREGADIRTPSAMQNEVPSSLAEISPQTI